MAAGEPKDAEGFLRDAESALLDLSIETQRAEWVQSTYITDDTTALASRAYARLIEATVRLAKEANRYRSAALAPETARRIHLLRTSLSLVAPSEPAAGMELTGLVNAMQAMYATARVPLPGTPEPANLEELERQLASSRDPDVQLAAWTGWHDAARGLRPKFLRYVELANRGAQEVGFSDLGELWRSKYDMPPGSFERETERLWSQVEPLYRALHAYVRRRLAATYGEDRVGGRDPLPAHLLGNMWAQSWVHLYPILAPAGERAAPDLTRVLLDRATTPRQMVEYGERFFTSLGLPTLPASFWERSMFVRPPDRQVVCHASAWDIDFVEDLRIKMCIDVTAEDFRTIHHELGHNYYQRAYAELPFLYRDGANDGFHEAIGDTISLSVTPEYLRKIGLSDGEDPSPSAEIGRLLHRALETIAFLPFGLLIDRWRWRVFDGTIPPERYNRAWWELRRTYQGIAPAVPRGEEEFDAGAKYHVAANVPYARYFLAAILQMQFHRGLAREIGWTGPLHRASIYGHPEAGARLGAMLRMGQSRPWPEALEAVCGEPRLDAGALLEYFAPLRAWLDEENRGAPLGW